MNETLIKIGISGISILLGNFISRIIDRAKPFLVIKEFSTGTKNGKSICTEEVSNLIRKSWYISYIEPGEVRWGELEKAYRVTVMQINDLENIEQRTERLIRQFSKANDTQSKKNALSMLFESENSEVLSMLQLIFLRNKALLPQTQYEGEPLMQAVLHGDRDGSFCIVFDDAVGRLGNNLNIDEWKRNALTPLVSAMQYLDFEMMKSNLQKLPDFATEQRNIHLKIKELLHPLRQKETIWLAKCSLTNYGKTPVIIYPEAQLQIFKNWRNKETPLPCYLAIQKKDNKDDADDLKGPKVLTSNETIQIWAITKQKKEEMENGNVVEGHFSDGDSYAKVVLRTNQRTIPFLKKTRSTKLIFKE